jgi:hypothetical protein
MTPAEVEPIVERAWAARDPHMHGMELHTATAIVESPPTGPAGPPLATPPMEQAATEVLYRVDVLTHTRRIVTLRELLPRMTGSPSHLADLVAQHTASGAIDAPRRIRVTTHTKHLYFHEGHELAHIESLIESGKGLLVSMSEDAPHRFLLSTKASRAPGVWDETAPHLEDNLSPAEIATYEQLCAEHHAPHVAVDDNVIPKRVPEWRLLWRRPV